MKNLLTVSSVTAISFFTVLAFTLPVHTAFAVTPLVTVPNTPGPEVNAHGPLKNPLKVDTLSALLLAVLDFVKIIGGIFVVLMLVFTGFKFVAAQGNPEKLSEARTSLFWTVLGALVLLGASVIAMGIDETVKAIS